ncbi:glycoside hydrolase family 16 protein [Pleomassaria siparia CBS 279.74]|uniref:Glycoside hydrolase family 16 protein n=1 Tax=Pleomassaria siparia CBS 279.74 TaxID=1314801 RepID=A0A6G1K6Y9_9PLEO|nr:glycoside hydrolase family 16 protein [Pleomassaria siparia CBS 279.74]
MDKRETQQRKDNSLDFTTGLPKHNSDDMPVPTSDNNGFMHPRSSESPEDHVTPQVRPRQNPNPFATPSGSQPASSGSSLSNYQSSIELPGRPSHRSSGEGSTGIYHSGGQKYFRSRRVVKGQVEQPWQDRKDPREKWMTIIPLIGVFIGFVVTGLLIWDGLRAVVNYKYCPVLDENFSSWDDNIWTKEVEVGGFGNGQFEQTTNTDENVYIKDGVLIIEPTIQDASLVDNDNVLDLRSQGCTGTKWTDCVASTNTTNGTIVNPVKSGRITTKLGASIKFGRVEVIAKLPQGDWLWPAIWMLPTDSEYGEWPKSGEIDIMESRGNNHSYAQGGNDIISSTLHFGPNPANDGWWRNNVKRQALHTTYSAGYHTFGLEWSEKYIFTYIDTRLLQVMYTHFQEPFWQYGRFPLSDSNGTRLRDPWGSTGSNVSPFDKDFYLVLDVAVGGTNGWFADGKSGKPWIDTSPTAKRDFWQAREQWYPTWKNQGYMQVKRVKMWQQQGYNGCIKGERYSAIGT